MEVKQRSTFGIAASRFDNGNPVLNITVSALMYHVLRQSMSDKAQKLCSLFYLAVIKIKGRVIILSFTQIADKYS